MALIVAPHSVTVAAPSPLGGISEKVPSFDGGISVACLVVPVSASSAFDRFGVEIERGWEVFIDPSSAPTFVVKARVTWDGRVLSVAAPPRLFTGIGALDHGVVLCAETGL